MSVLRKRIFLSGLIIFLVTALLASFVPASAHANLVRSEPRANDVLDVAPTVLKLWFSETPEPNLTSIQLRDSSGATISGLGKPTPDANDKKQITIALPSLPHGVYTVLWTTVSADDGHASAGGFAFVIGREQVPEGGLSAATSAPISTTPSPLSVALRWLNYLSLAMLLGGFSFVPLIWRPSLARADALLNEQNTVQKGRARQTMTISRQPFSQGIGLLRVLALSTAVQAIALIVQAFDQAATVNTHVIRLITGSRYGAILALKVVLVILLAVVLFVRGSRWWHSAWAMRFWYVGMAISSALLFAVSLTSHAAALSSNSVGLPLPLLTDWFHLILVSVWLGGLFTLLLTLRWIYAQEGAGATAAIVTSRFSQIATICIVLVLTTGIIQSVLQLGPITNFVDTRYGQTLLFKLIAFLPLVGIAGWNFLTTRRRISGSVSAEAVKTSEIRLADLKLDLNADPKVNLNDKTAISREDLPAWQRMISRTVLSEVVIMAIMMGVTGLLAALPPARDAFGSGVVARLQADDLRVIVAINPGSPGLNTFDIYVRDVFGIPVDDAQKVALLFGSTDMSMGTTEAVAKQTDEPGHYVIDGDYISMSGGWDIESLVRRSGLDDVRARINVTFLQMPTNSYAPVLNAASGPAAIVSPVRLVLAVELLIAGFLVVRSSRKALTQNPSPTRLRNTRVWLAVGVALLVAGVGFGANDVIILAQRATKPPSPERVNKIPADDLSLVRGRIVYTANCATCHGDAGDGKGTLGQNFNPPPADFRVHMQTGHSDGQLFNWVSEGKPNTAMPSFGYRLTEQEIWDVINYIKTFGGNK